MLTLFKNNNYKILDTSILIDSRIIEILSSGFLEGEIIVPQFVIDELHKLADSQNIDKKNKGKRGIEILNKLNKIKKIEIWNKKNKQIDSINHTDTKLIYLCKEINGRLLTIDYNLNQIAKVHNVIVLNINDLFNAVRPKFLVGDKITIKIKKEGNKDNQGVGHLEDGTTVFVDDGKKYIGKKITVEVRQIMQDSSARMVFAVII